MTINPMLIIKIIAYILKIISEGATRAEAVNMASSKFGISESDIWGIGGF